MEDFKEIIKEIQVDWDDTLKPNFNPLKLLLKTLSNSKVDKEFRETFHRLESAMDKVIKSNFKGFSESFRSFEMLNEDNIAIINKYEELEEMLKDIGNLQDDLENFNLNTTEENENKAIYEICAKIIEARNFYKEFCLVIDAEKRSSLIIKSLKILREYGLSQIRGVFEFYKIVLKSYVNFANDIHDKLLDFVVKDKSQNIKYFPLVLRLNSTSQFNQFCSESLYLKIFNCVELELSRSVQTEECTIDMLCKQVMVLMETIIENMTILIRRFLQIGPPEEEDFFGKNKIQKGFIYEINMTIDVLKQILSKFIDLYSFEFKPNNSFDISYVPDVIDFTNEFEKGSAVIQRLTSLNNATRTQFTLVTGTSPQTAEILLKFTKNKDLRWFLKKIVENKNFIETPLQSKIVEVEKTLEQKTENDIDPYKIDNFIIKSLDCSLSRDENTQFKNFLKQKILEFFVNAFDKIFQSDFVKKPFFKSFLPKVKEGKYKEFLKVDNYVFTVDELKEQLISKAPTKNTLFHKSKSYEIVRNILEQLKSLESHLKSEELTFLVALYSSSIERQIIVDFFYYYDLLYRQGNYHYYMKSCLEVLQSAKHFEIDVIEDFENCFIFYNKMNVESIKVKSVEELEEMISFLQIFYQITGPDYETIKVIEFFKNVISNQQENRQGKILQKKIKQK